MQISVCGYVCARPEKWLNKQAPVKPTTDSRLYAYKCVWELDLASFFVARRHGYAVDGNENETEHENEFNAVERGVVKVKSF